MRRGLATSSQTVASAVFDGEKFMFANLVDANLHNISDQTLTDYCQTVFDYSEKLAEPVRVQAAETALALAPLCFKGTMLRETFDRLLTRTSATERSQSVQQILREIAKALPLS